MTSYALLVHWASNNPSVGHYFRLRDAVWQDHSGAGQWGFARSSVYCEQGKVVRVSHYREDHRMGWVSWGDRSMTSRVIWSIDSSVTNKGFVCGLEWQPSREASSSPST